MSSSDRIARGAALLAISLAWLWHAARAALCSATTDEAFTALDFAGKPWLDMLAYYDANNHVLHTILVKLSLDALGWNVVALRLPVLLAGLLYSLMVWRLGRRWFGDTLPMAAFCAAAAWVAPVAEYFSLARGYGLAVAFYAWALFEADHEDTARWPRISFALGLSIASNLVFVVPAVALAAVLLARSRAWREVRSLAAPGAVAALVLLALPLSRAEAANFYFGAATWSESLRSLFEWPGLPNTSLLLAALLPLLALAALGHPPSRLLALTALLSAALAALLGAGGVPWPRGRTGVYLSFLIFCAAVRWALQWPRLSWLVLLVAPVSWLAMPLRSHPEWPGDATARATVERIAATAPPGKTVVIAAEFPLNYAIAFHARELMGARAIVTRPDAASRPPDYEIRLSAPVELRTK